MHEVRVEPRSVEVFRSLVGAETVDHFRWVAEGLTRKLGQRTIWNVSSTAAGPGVAEMQHTLLGYARALGVETRWMVLDGTPEFHALTARLHHAIHGGTGDAARLGEEAALVYERVLGAAATKLVALVQPEDVVILHDPPTAGLIPHLAQHGAGVVWRCHGGTEARTADGERAWAFLERYLVRAHAFVFPRFSHAPDFLYQGRCLVVPPSIDPFSAKNHEMDPCTVRGLLAHLHLVAGGNGSPGYDVRLADGTALRVHNGVEVLHEGPPPSVDTPLVVQVARWDRLKDPLGVLEGFGRAMGHAAADQAAFVLAGPQPGPDADDPEGAEAYREVVERWKALPVEQRRRLQVVSLPAADAQENAVIVNALQRHARLVVQKSLREGFCLTVTEAMWKGKPVVAAAVGGCQEQIEHGVSGLLLRSPSDLDAFAGAILQVLTNPGLASRLGWNARRRVSQHYLGLGIVSHFDDLVERLNHELPAVVAPAG